MPRVWCALGLVKSSSAVSAAATRMEVVFIACLKYVEHVPPGFDRPEHHVQTAETLSFHACRDLAEPIETAPIAAPATITP